jgi:hypothetical protein
MPNGDVINWVLINSKPFACIGVAFGLGVIIVQTLPGAYPVTARKSLVEWTVSTGD